MIEAVKGDITQLEVDAIVNAANSSLLGGGGVDGAIHRAAGPELLDECRRLNGCKTGQAKITRGYHLKAKHVIHAVGPVWHGGSKNEDELLQSAYKTSLELVVKYQCESVAFPCISTGVYGFPFERAERIAISTIKEFQFDHPTLKKILLVCFSEEDFANVKKLLLQETIV